MGWHRQYEKNKREYDFGRHPWVRKRSMGDSTAPNWGIGNPSGESLSRALSARP
jgi:hypothetical protein